MAVYQQLLSRSPTTRAELAQNTSLSVPTVGTVIKEFEKLGLVTNGGQTEPRGGRPAQLLHFAADARYVLSVDLSGAHAEGAVVNLFGEVVEEYTGPPLAPKREHELFGWLAQRLNASKNIGMLGVAVPSVADTGTRHVRLAPSLGWSDFDLTEALRSYTNLPFVLENDVNALAVAEKSYGNASDFEHILHIAVHQGLGASLMLGGKLYRGATGAAGEIGYSVTSPGMVLPKGQVAHLGSPGPLEARLNTLQRDFVVSGQVTLASERARRSLDTFLDLLGLAVHNLVCVLNPEVVLVSWAAEPHDILIEGLGARLEPPFKVALRAPSLGDAAIKLGVARLALDALELELCRSPLMENP